MTKESAVYDLEMGKSANLNGKPSGAVALSKAFKSANISEHEVPEGYNEYTGKWEDSNIRESPSRHPTAGYSTSENISNFNGNRYKANGNPNNPHTTWERY